MSNFRRISPRLLVCLSMAAIATSAGAQTLSRASVSTAGNQSVASGAFFNGSFVFSVSDDGRYVVFQSNASNLIDGESISGTQVYLRDRLLNQTVLVSRTPSGTPGAGTSELARISGDGSAVVFQSAAADLVAGDTNGSTDVFVWSRSSASISRVSVDSFGAQGNGNSSDTYGPAISADGRYVAFTSVASNLVSVPPGGTNRAHIYRFDRRTNNTLRVSLVNASVTTPGGSLSTSPTISGDGDRVAFRSAATNLVSGDTNAINDVFVRTISSGSTARVSLTAAGGQIASGSAAEPSISRDGTLVVFTHTGNLTDGTTSQPNVYLRSIAAGTTTRLVVAATGGCYTPVFSGDGNFVGFSSWDAALVAGDSNGFEDIFVYDRAAASVRRVSVSLDGTQSNSDSFGPALNFDASVVVFDSDASNLVAADTNGVSDAFVFDSNPVIGPPCLADVTLDGVVDGSDFVAFVNSFSAGNIGVDPLADVNVDGVIDGSDFVAFVNAFGAGC